MGKGKRPKGAHFFFVVGVSGPVTWRQVTGAVAVALVLAAVLVLYVA
ncbi:hypothetical protein [Amycolatopsis tolypomycina]